MKRNLARLLALAALALLTACTGPAGPQGPVGATGPTGPQGPQGPSGNANVKTYRFTGLSGKWTTPAAALGYTHSIALTLPISDDEATSLYNSGAILVYVQDFNSYRWWALPTYLYNSDVTFQQERGTPAQQKVINLSGVLRSGSGTPVSLSDAKVILIFSTQQGNPIPLSLPGSSRASRLVPALRGVDLSDYEVVRRALALPE